MGAEAKLNRGERPSTGQLGEALWFRCWFRHRFQSSATEVPFSESGLREGDFRFAATKVPFSEVGFRRGEKGPPIWDKPQTGSSRDACKVTRGAHPGAGAAVDSKCPHLGKRGRTRQPPSHLTLEGRLGTPMRDRHRSRGGNLGRGCRRRRVDAVRCCTHLPGPSHL